MLLPQPRGPLSTELFDRMKDGSWRSYGADPCALAPAVAVPAILDDEDAQISLWALYELHYRGFDDVAPEYEWAAELLGVRRRLEVAFEHVLRERSREHVESVRDGTGGLADRLFGLCDSFEGPSLAEYVRRSATRGQLREFLLHRSIFQLKEADPHSWVIPRLTGAAKAALVELQFDEYGDGRADRVHQDLYAETLRLTGLDPDYGAYVDAVPATTLALSNAASMFGLHRRLRAAAMGHLGAVEATSSVPSRHYADAIRRLGFDDAAALYFDEHVEADAVHEHLALRGICAPLAADDPAAEDEITFGMATCLLLESRWATRVLDAWESGRHLVEPPAERPASVPA